MALCYVEKPSKIAKIGPFSWIFDYRLHSSCIFRYCNEQIFVVTCDLLLNYSFRLGSHYGMIIFTIFGMVSPHEVKPKFCSPYTCTRVLITLAANNLKM